jgi:molecular chaperone GrpE
VPAEGQEKIMQDYSMNQEDDRVSQASSESPQGDRTQAGQAGDSTPGLEELLRKAELQVQEHREAWLRAKAETDNMRKRADAEVANARKFGVESFANALLPVKDSLEAALAVENDTVESLRTGVEITLRQLAAAFDKFNLTEIDPQGQKFDPHRHEAMTMVQSDAEPNTVVQVLQKGYALHDRVIRPALVSVAAPKQG